MAKARQITLEHDLEWGTFMDPSHLTEDQRNEIRGQKRAVWAQEGAGNHYFHLVHQNEPVVRLRNLTETGFVLQHALGPKNLDAGAGTGRFTFPLLGADYQVVALDISRDMLGRGKAYAREERKAFPCVQGELERLPFSDGIFDSVVSMTVLRHFPQW